MSQKAQIASPLSGLLRRCKKPLSFLLCDLMEEGNGGAPRPRPRPRALPFAFGGCGEAFELEAAASCVDEDLAFAA